MATTLQIPLLNRELSRLDYNRRVLSRAQDPAVPLLERVGFLSFCSSNLDEFFMVRVAAIRDLLDAGISDPSPDGLVPADQMAAMRQSSRDLLRDMDRCLDSLLPELERNGIAIRQFEQLPADEQTALRSWFLESVSPLLTPLAVDPGHPFPFVANQAMNVAVIVGSSRGDDHIVLIKLPPMLPRLVEAGKDRFVPLASLVVSQLDHFFPAHEIRATSTFRVLRNSELSIDGDEVENLRESVEAELRRRERKQVVCLEIEAGAREEIVAMLARGTKTRDEDIYAVGGFVRASDLAGLGERVGVPSLSYPEFNPRLPQRLASPADIFSIIRAGDIVLHRPYESFTAVIELLHAAATDPAVAAIKQTLYETDEESPVIDKLVLAAQNGKQVTVVIEIQARFAEKRNIALATRLQDAGAQVVYGLVGIQAHAKVCLIVREEEGVLRPYTHLSTGNYNVDTARVYTDIDLLTANPAFGQEATRLMNVLTGYSSASLGQVLERGALHPQWTHFILAPFDYHRALIGLIEREGKHAAAGRPARITAKLNSLVDPLVIDAIYRAADQGVSVELVIRGICCLVPRQNIRVISIVDRFLEHSRIVRFENGGNAEVFLSSGDWMPRNFFRRVELMFPLVDAAVRERVEGILAMSVEDTASSWELDPSGAWTRRGGEVSSQQRFIDLVRSEALPLGPYDAAIEAAPRIRKRARSRRR